MSAPPSSDLATRRGQILASYLPRYQRLLLRQNGGSRSAPFCEEKPGAILLVDVSGFTALTERFARQGAGGAEELSGILNRYFGRVTDVIAQHGGDVIAFAGDSALAMWPGDDENLTDNVIRAAEAAQKIQKELDRWEPAPGVELRQRAGIGGGRLRLMELGGVDRRWQFVVTGDPIAEASSANHQAKPGEFLLGPLAADLVGRRMSGLETVFTEPKREARPAVSNSDGNVSFELVSPEVFSNYVPLVVSERLRAGQEQWIAEFRTLSMMFVNLADGDRCSVSDLHQRLATIQQILLRYEGTLYQFLMDDKGVTAVCAFGLPPLAHEDDPRRAVEAALTAHEELDHVGAESDIGIASGTVFCGVYGNADRRQYTTLGNTINLAARLMQTSDGGILCDDNTYRSAMSGVRFEAQGQIAVKGRSQPVSVFAPQEKEKSVSPAEPDRHIETLGRESERSTLRAAAEGLCDHARSSVFVIVGEAGIGKSRLIDDLERDLCEMNVGRASQVPCWRVTGDSIRQSTPYFAWRGAFRELFGIQEADEEQARNFVMGFLSTREEWEQVAPLLNVVLPLNIHETVVSAKMEGQARAENTQRFLVSLLQAAPQNARVLLLDDAHWLDSASWRLALLAAQQVERLMLVLATRPMAEPPLEYAALTGMASSKSLALQALTPDLGVKIACQRLHVHRVPPEVARFIAERGKGHPLFSEQLAYALRDAGLLQISGTQCQIPESATGAGFDAALAALRFPSTVEGVITSRLDRLPPEVQLTLKVASVVGATFNEKVVREIHPVQSDVGNIGQHLQQAARLDLVESNGENSYRFRQAITHEVAYNSVPFAQRRQLHRGLAEWLECEFRADLKQQYPLLAHHWRRAEDDDKSIHYCSEAGAQALQNHANQEAVRFLSEALQIDGKRGDPIDSHGRAEWELQLGKAYVNWSKYIEARTHLERGLRLQGQTIPSGPAGTAGKLIAQVGEQWLHRKFPRKYVGLGREQRESLLKFARTFEALTEIYYLQDMSLPCLLAVFRSLNLAELAGSSPELARGYSSAGSLVGFMTLHKAAKSYFELAEKISAEIQDPASRAWVSLARAMYLAGVGQWDLASGLLVDAMTIDDRLGDRRRGDDCRIVLGVLEHLRGNFRRSLEIAASLYESAGERLDARCQAEALRIRAYNLVVLNCVDELRDCVEELDSLRTAQVKFGGTHQKQDVHALRAILSLADGKRDAARAAADNSAKALAATSNNFFDYLLERSAIADVYLTLCETSSNTALRQAAHRAIKGLHAYCRVFSIGRTLAALHAGNLLWIEGKRDRATASCRKALQHAEELGSSYYQGLAHAALAAQGDREHLREAHSLLERVSALRDLKKLDETTRAIA